MDVDGDEDEHRVMWLAGLPDETTHAAVQQLVEERVAEASTQLGRDTSPPQVQHVWLATDQVGARCTGSAKISFEDTRGMLVACAALDGAQGLPDETGNRMAPLLAMPEAQARPRRAVHTRLHDALRRLTGTRSFHNFSPGFTSATDPKSIRSVYRCRSGITSGFRDLCTGNAFAVLRFNGRDFLYRQILSMAGLVIAVVSGAVPVSYMDLALGVQSGIEVPVAPAGNLLLAECFFRDGIFKPEGEEAAVAKATLVEAVIREAASEKNQAAFAKFVAELRETHGPRMTAELAAMQARGLAQSSASDGDGDAAEDDA
eukprot:gnl/TRDRNA2_/TRDRNA2_148827_c0_seq1.p1 gnl/TRDRNA2_/TRDRNA2_148827_c0~~gnl/TRDRNA2_/TRDRNA2_148827_c0_seq1.p1  ORF type:complete len:346 (+),score=63.57 gnl/TRDRNA2_/TRDRNA2_148827_c0_seq1:92-1039(+)